MMHVEPATLEQATMRKVFWRIVPYTFVLYVISYLDRANLGYAALEMNRDLALSAEAFGFAGGVFFIGYFFSEVPSNIALQKFGARLWLSRILVTWGIVAVLTGFAQNATQLYILRFLLGVSEAGFFPGIIVYLTYWFRSKEQATTIAYFMAAIPVSFLVGAPLSTFIMDNVSGFGLEGWRWMLVLEGIPAVAAGIFNALYMTDGPAKAKWLKPDEREWLMQALARDNAQRVPLRDHSLWRAIVDPKVLFLSLIYFICQFGNLGIGLWMPQIIKGLGTDVSNLQIGLIAMVPYAVATVAMVMWSKNSDRTGERQRHCAIPLLVGGLALAAMGLSGNPYVAIGLISLALAGLYAFKSPFWSLPSLLFPQSSVAVSVAAINSIGNLGGFAGPYAIGWVKSSTGSTLGGLLFLAGLMILSFFMAWFMRLPKVGSKAERS